MAQNFARWIRKCEKCEEEFLPDVVGDRYCPDCDPAVTAPIFEPIDREE